MSKFSFREKEQLVIKHRSLLLTILEHEAEDLGIFEKMNKDSEYVLVLLDDFFKKLNQQNKFRNISNSAVIFGLQILADKLIAKLLDDEDVARLHEYERQNNNGTNPTTKDGKDWLQ